MTVKPHTRMTIEHRLAQARRLARDPIDDLTKERLERLIGELEISLTITRCNRVQ
jgi:hypothetical protein